MEIEKLKSLLADFQKAIVSLKEAFALPAIDINIDGTIQRFEYTFELGWKLMRAVADYQGKESEARNPRNAIRYGAYIELIDNPEAWFTHLNTRNSTVHLYNKEASRDVYEKIKTFPAAADQLAKHALELCAK